MLPVFVVNLDRSPERLAAVGGELDRLGIVWERFAAVDGRALPADVAARNRVVPWRRPLRLGEIGCFASHHTIWRLIVERGLDAAVVLEDDIHLGTRLPEVLTLLETTPERPDFLRLMALIPKPGPAGPALGAFATVEAFAFSVCSGTQGYFLTAAAARRFLAAAERWTLPVDNYMDKSWMHGVPNLRLDPPVIACAAFASEIVAMAPPPTGRRGWVDRLLHEAGRIVEWFAYAAWVVRRHLPRGLSRRDG